MPRLAFAPGSRPRTATPPGRLAAFLCRIWNAAQREHRLRATIRTLHGLNDRTLRDIGLHRGNIEDVVRARCREW